MASRKGMTSLPSWMIAEKRSRSAKYVIQKFDYFYVIDFEATCLKDKLIQPQEIIEIPCLAINGKSFNIEETFHSYVRPIVNPTLSTFCTYLTGISQDEVDKSPSFVEIYPQLNEFISKRSSNFTFVTCGDWDLRTMLTNQSKLSGIHLPQYYSSWINLKKSYGRAMGQFPKSIHGLLGGLNMKFEGRPHSGIDDVHNIYRVLKALSLEKKVLFKNTTQNYVEIEKENAPIMFINKKFR